MKQLACAVLLRTLCDIWLLHKHRSDDLTVEGGQHISLYEIDEFLNSEDFELFKFIAGMDLLTADDFWRTGKRWNRITWRNIETALLGG